MEPLRCILQSLQEANAKETKIDATRPTTCLRQGGTLLKRFLVLVCSSLDWSRNRSCSYACPQFLVECPPLNLPIRFVVRFSGISDWPTTNHKVSR